MWEKWLRLPLGFRILVVVLALVALVAVVALIDPRVALFVVSGLLVLGCLLGGYALFRRWSTARASKKFSASIDQSNVFLPGSITDPAQRARLADLRQVFEKGLKEFANAGKDIYSLPWYLVCGEPGSGKTETLRHSNVGFPPGLQDEMQGVGGTINMHWWFTNHAVILDTAGKMLFQEAQPGNTSEWLEFLGLLKKHRPNCPINGMLLVIPADSLLKDNPDEIRRKAGRIVHQLDQIQKVLDVRFPVFVMISKCDLIYGFREFFSSIGDVRLQQQMLGWSNPEPLDVPFRMDLVTSYMEKIGSRLRRRRLLLMRDPAPAMAGTRRIDEVDALFNFPAGLSAITSRLRQYLDVIFVSGEWTQKPLFLRGVYFTSSLTEGSALDVELASILGVPVDHLAEKKSWERNRAFFLRDLFLQKIFREKGLVTGASDTRAIVRRRRAIVGTVAAFGVALLMWVSWIGTSALKSSVVAELDYWQTGAEGWKDGYWHPILIPSQTAGQWNYAGREMVKVGRRTMPVVDYHDEIEKLAGQDIPLPWIYRPMASLVIGTDEKRRRAQRILFESSVVAPLVESARMTLLDQNAGWSDLNAQRMSLLLKIEGLISQRVRNGRIIGVGQTLESDYFFYTTLQPWLGLEPVPRGLPRVFDATLLSPGAAPWPESWMSAGRTLDENRPLMQGWITFANAVRSVRVDQQVGLDQIRNTRVAVETHLSREKEFFRVANNLDGERWQAALDVAYEGMLASHSTVYEMLNRTAALDGMPSSLFTLKGAYQAMFEHARERSRAAAHAIALACTPPSLPAGVKMSERLPELPLFTELQRRLTDVDQAIDQTYQASLSPNEMNSIPKLDMEATVPAAGTSDRVYAYRFDVFRDVLAQTFVRAENYHTLLGRLNEAFNEQQTALAAISARAVKYEGELRPEFARAAHSLLDKAYACGPVNLVEKYSRELEQLLVEKAGFPVMRGAGGMKENQMCELFAELQKVAKDSRLEAVPSVARPAYARAAFRMNQVIDFVRAVSRPSGAGVPVKVCVASLADQHWMLERLAPGVPFSDIFAGSRYRTLRLGNKAVRTQSSASAEICSIPVSDTLPIFEFFQGAETKPKPDAQAVLNGNWGMLRLFSQEKHCLATDGGRAWLCPIEVVEGQVRSFFVLSVQFEQPVPPVDQWP